jgi:hypothetical protein
MNILYYIIMAVAAWILYCTVWQTVKEAWQARRLQREGDRLMDELSETYGKE